MKKLAAATALIITLVVTCMAFAGGPLTWVLVPISSAAYVSVDLPSGVSCADVAYYTEDGAPVLFATDSSGTNEREALGDIKGESHSDVCVGYGTTSVVYCKGTTSTNLVLLYNALN